MTKAVLSDLVNLQNETSAVNTINANNAVIETAFDNTLSRDGTSPNYMNAGIDMNSQPILNLPQPISLAEPLRLQDLADFLNGSLVITIPTAPTIYVSTYTAGGTSDDTAGIQAAIDAANTAGGGTVVFDSIKTYTVAQLNVFSNTILDGNNCLIIQKALNTIQFRAVNQTNITWKNFRYRGAFYPATDGVAASGNSDNTTIRTENCSNIKVKDNTFEYCAYHCVRLVTTTDYEISGNFIRYCTGGILLTGTERGSVINNRLYHTCLYSLNPTLDQFTTAIQLESTDVNGTLSPLNPVNKHVTISNNIIQDYPYAQGIFAHAGQNITVSNNIIENVSVCISFNPYNTVDYMNWVTITSNICKGTQLTTIPPSFHADAGIYVVGGPAALGGTTPVIDTFTISNNVIQACNRVALDLGLGGIVIGYTSNCSVSGNIVQGCGCNCISTVSSEDGLVITGNNFNTPTGGSAVGLHMFASLGGVVVGNTFRSCTTGQKQEAGVGSLTRGNNGYFSCATNEA